MTEPYPLLDDLGSLKGVLVSGGDATGLYYLNGGVKTFLWVSTEQAVEISKHLREGFLVAGDVKVSIKSWLEFLPYIHARVLGSVEEYAEWLARKVRGQLEGRRVLLGLSGGKDSVAALVVLVELMKYVNFKLRVMYVHIPILEGRRNLRFIDELSRKLNIPVEIVEAPRRELKSLLRWRGLPKRGGRWCTYFKVKPMRKARKEDPRLIEVVADRISEAPKRFERMKLLAAHGVILSGRRFRPTYILGLADVVEVVRSKGLVHPDYLMGMPRVSCTYCPYKALYELDEYIVRQTEPEDPGLVEELMRREHSKRYSDVSWEEFTSMHLWRFKPGLACRLRKLYARLRLEMSSEAFTREQIMELYRRVWKLGLPSIKKLENPWMFCEILFRAVRARKVLVIP